MKPRHSSSNARLSRAIFHALSPVLLLSACSGKPDNFFPGYIEADYVRLAAPVGGALVKLHVERGAQVSRNDPAFMLESDEERAAVWEASSRVARAEAQLNDLRKGKRPDEVAAVAAQLEQARAAQALSAASLAREKQLASARFVSPSRIDEAQAALDRDAARVRELQAQLRVAKLGARSDEIAAAQQELQAAQAQLAQVNWRLEQKTQRIPVDAEVADVLYREGELVPVGSPVVSLLAPQYLKARFFVPETMVGKLFLGQEVNLRCDGCGAPIAAKLSFIAREAQYTSPLIYSKENRATLVFLIEARPASKDAARLHPGQPLEVRLGTVERFGP
ncbi:HlyD family secretion protein [Paucimonas lemoignei]|uniref:HlyD family secretion protein n=1 Tax=Paucimonas lemoignei TaxID=29443 RepID=A0A4R3HZ72_PAULE|nr:HlyD family efflux transporter periplasmic adaptor subunit [Paucimonas lemoignei]TCS38542.1 HlyD family secretion protein [Paucimonas lemoignei]